VLEIHILNAISLRELEEEFQNSPPIPTGSTQTPIIPTVLLPFKKKFTFELN